MLKDRHIIVFGEDFDRHPHCLEHLVRRFLPENKVLWVETIGMRSPRFSLYDVKRVLEKLRSWIKPKETDTQKVLPVGLTCISPLMIPYNQYRLIRKWNRFLVVKKVKKAMQELGFVSPLLITSIPSTCDFVGEFNESLSIYYCVDEFSLWPGIDPKVVGPMEATLISKVDLVLTTSSALWEAKKRLHPNTELLTHGVDVDHFRTLTEIKGNRKKVGFFGLIDERIDIPLVWGLSKRFPGVEFHFIGDVIVDVSSLNYQRNIVWRGKLPYTELPDAIRDISVFILPYRINELTRHINPLKIKEYMATGRPIVATPLEELSRYQDVMFLAQDAESFYRGVGEALEERGVSAPERLQSYLQGEAWSDKALWLSQRVHDLEVP